MIRRALVIVALAGAPAVARADDGLGTPLPDAGALPALGGATYQFSLDLVDAHTLPPLDLGGVTAPGRSAAYAGATLASCGGGLGPGWFGYFCLAGAGYGFGFGNADPVSTRYFSVTLPSPGYGYRTRALLAGMQLVPRIEWFSETVTTSTSSANDRDHYYTLSADMQVCLQYNFLGLWPSNSAACLYAAPEVYRAGWLDGFTVGVRVYPL
ncbi:MAG TPA: hypothetical protein VMJ10_14985 [Kofleriaceae bacterium]|nr:hypothetical protein [Kofleriaceae bacterium]